jgi:hypothetical protein
VRTPTSLSRRADKAETDNFFTERRYRRREERKKLPLAPTKRTVNDFYDKKERKRQN